MDGRLNSIRYIIKGVRVTITECSSVEYLFSDN
jgi:hypothetical protein